MPRYRYTQKQLEQMAANPWLTDRERVAFDLHYRRGWHIEDVAAELDVSRGTINNTLASIRRKSL
nr:MAG TPA: Sigma70 [Caudoviricetes sp.]